MSKLGKTCIIANPVAQSGACANVAHQIFDILREGLSDTEFDLQFTEGIGHATEIAAAAEGKFGTVIVIGGDGAAHETVNGLMQIPIDARPKFAVVPVGSGNDYAYTLGMSSNPQKAAKQIMWCKTEMMDIGCANGEYFCETLSFGVDAAIAIDTMTRRKKSGRKGTILYLESGINQIFRNLKSYEFEAVLFGDETPEGLFATNSFDKHDTSSKRDMSNALHETTYLSGNELMFAVQIGKTYGGHFNICPQANPTDGYFDICILDRKISASKALRTFLAARFGGHKNSPLFKFYRAKNLTIDFKKMPPCQIDGEIFEHKSFVISTIPGALEAIVGSKRGWK